MLFFLVSLGVLGSRGGLVSQNDYKGTAFLRNEQIFFDFFVFFAVLAVVRGRFCVGKHKNERLVCKNAYLRAEWSSEVGETA